MSWLIENYRSYGRRAVIVLVLVGAPVAPFLLAASTGVVVSPSTHTAYEGERVKFVASTLYSEGVTEGTAIVVSDNASGSFYNGSISSGCSSTAAPVMTKRFSIEKNKAFCYSNPIPGIYFITVQLQDGEGVSLGDPAVAEVTVLASTTEPVVSETDIAITKTVTNERPQVNERVSYTITVTNLGMATATTIIVEDILPTEVKFVSASPAPELSNKLTWEKAELAPGETFVITLVGEIGSESVGLSLINDVTVTSDTKDDDLTNNTASAHVYPQVVPEQESDTYQLEGYVWHDSNQNGEVDSDLSGTSEKEKGLHGWSVTASSGTTTVEAMTDVAGKYSLTVTPGTWTITSEVLPGWERTTPESYVVVVPEEVAEEMATWSRRWWEYVVPVAEAALIATYDGYDFGVYAVPVPLDVERQSSGSRSSVTRVKQSGTPTLPLVMADDTPLIGATQVTFIPVGAPATGQGGATSRLHTLLLQHLLYREPRRSSWYED